MLMGLNYFSSIEKGPLRSRLRGSLIFIRKPTKTNHKIEKFSLSINKNTLV